MGSCSSHLCVELSTYQIIPLLHLFIHGRGVKRAMSVLSFTVHKFTTSNPSLSVCLKLCSSIATALRNHLHYQRVSKGSRLRYYRAMAGSVGSNRLPFLGRFPQGVRNHIVAMSGEFTGTFLFLFFAFSGTYVILRSFHSLPSPLIELKKSCGSTWLKNTLFVAHHLSEDELADSGITNSQVAKTTNAQKQTQGSAPVTTVDQGPNPSPIAVHQAYVLAFP